MPNNIIFPLIHHGKMNPENQYRWGRYKSLQDLFLNLGKFRAFKFCHEQEYNSYCFYNFVNSCTNQFTFITYRVFFPNQNLVKITRNVATGGKQVKCCCYKQYKQYKALPESSAESTDLFVDNNSREHLNMFLTSVDLCVLSTGFLRCLKFCLQLSQHSGWRISEIHAHTRIKKKKRTENYNF